MDEKILPFFKTFCDPTRIRLAALLMDEALSAETIASKLNLRASELPRHLSQFEALGLLTLDGDRYQIDRKAIERLSRETLASLRPTVAAHSNDENADDFDRSVVKNFSLPNGRLKEIPLQPRKFQAVLRHVATVFEPGQRYTEKEVKELLKRYHDDFATLRRGLVDSQLIHREADGSVYWRSE